MARHVIGTDEAGYGPNLGPLVISATQWTTPVPIAEFDLWEALSPAVSESPTSDGRLHVADSKQVYSPGKGLASLERSVLSLLGVVRSSPRTLIELRQELISWRSPEPAEFQAGWYMEEDVALPVAADSDQIARGTEQLRLAMEQSGVTLQGIRSDIVSELRFNRLTDEAGSKGAVLTEATLTLADSCCRETSEPKLVLCDKHGGRNRYAGVLSHLSEDGLVFTRGESREQSIYQLGPVEFRFETRAERHLPVAAASMVSKYLRELSMLAFNAWWGRHQSGIKPTKGYPQDAARFRAEVAETQSVLGVPNDHFWRRR